MNTRHCRAKFKNFQIILDSGCSSTILMGRLVGKINPEKYDVMQWHMQAQNFTTDIKIKVDITLPALSAMNSVMCKFHMNDSARGRYDMILGQDILTELGLYLIFSEHVIESGDGHSKGYTTPMIYLCTYIFKYLNTDKFTSE